MKPMTTPTLREALAELVALKDIKECAERCWPGDPEGPELLREYSTRKDAAWIAARLALTAPEQSPADGGQETWHSMVVHGVTCEKVAHTRDGHLHAEDDDTPYDVDGVSYCGRCHRSLP